MCGIVGIVGNIAHKEEKVFKDLLYMDTLRGPHSTGFIGVTEAGVLQTDKHLGTPTEFFEKSSFFTKKGVYLSKAKVLIGHNRWATEGAITVDNAHPFDFDKVIGVHNGTLDKPYKPKLGVDTAIEVDSEAIYASINEKGVRGTLPLVSGSWSLMMWNKERKRLEFIRNDKRPMFYSYSEDKKTVFLASEGWMIEAACSRHDVKHDSIQSTGEDKLYFIDPNQTTVRKAKGKKKSSDTKEIYFKFENKKVIGGVKPIATTRTYYGYGQWDNWQDQEDKKQGNLPTTITQIGQSKTKKIGTSNLISGQSAINSSRVNSFTDKDVTIQIYYKGVRDITNVGQFMTFHTMLHDTPVWVRVAKLSRERKDIEMRKDLNVFYRAKLNNTVFNSTGGVMRYIVQANSLSDPIAVRDYLYAYDNGTVYEPNRFGKEDDEGNKDETKPKLLIPGYRSEVMYEDLYCNRIASGCANCTDNTSSIDDAPHITWLDRETYICPTCSKDDNVLKQIGGIT